LGADPLHMLFEQVAGPIGAPDAAGVFCGGLRVVSMDGSTTDVPNSKANAEYFGRPSNATRDGAFPQVRSRDRHQRRNSRELGGDLSA
jgi:hypothetical protein